MLVYLPMFKSMGSRMDYLTIPKPTRHIRRTPVQRAAVMPECASPVPAIHAFRTNAHDDWMTPFFSEVAICWPTWRLHSPSPSRWLAGYVIFRGLFILSGQPTPSLESSAIAGKEALYLPFIMIWRFRGSRCTANIARRCGQRRPLFMPGPSVAWGGLFYQPIPVHTLY